MNGDVKEYDIPTPNSRPHAIIAGHNDDIWFTEWGANQIGQISIISREIKEYEITILASEPHGITCDSNGDIWFASECNKIGHIKNNS